MNKKVIRKDRKHGEEDAKQRKEEKRKDNKKDKAPVEKKRQATGLIIDKETSQEALLFNIFEIANRGPGAEISYKLDGIEPDLSKYNITIKGAIEGKISIMKIENEYNVSIKDFKATVTLTCEKCLEKFDFIVEIQYTERQFLITEEAFENRFDFFYIDAKNHQVDIEEFLRQEIILHFPLVAVCSPHCKGINLN